MSEEKSTTRQGSICAEILSQAVNFKLVSRDHIAGSRDTGQRIPCYASCQLTMT